MKQERGVGTNGARCHTIEQQGRGVNMLEGRRVGIMS